jgi:hypothetical protein
LEGLNRKLSQNFRVNLENRAKEYLMLKSGWYNGKNVIPSLKLDWATFKSNKVGTNDVPNIRDKALKYAQKVSGKSDTEILAMGNPLSN